jgi:hypothetical protein
MTWWLFFAHVILALIVILVLLVFVVMRVGL